MAKRRRASSVAPFDVVAEIGRLLAASGLTLEALRQTDAAVALEALIGELAGDLRAAPVRQRARLRLAAFVGYLGGLTTGLQLGAMAAERSEAHLLALITAALEEGEFDPTAYGFVLGVLKPDRNFVVPDQDRVH